MQYLVTVRGTLKGADEAESKKMHDMTAAQAQPIGKSLGNVSHQPYLNPENPKEFFDIDVWDSLEGLQKFFSDPNMGKIMAELFEGQPEVRVWTDKGWYKW